MRTRVKGERRTPTPQECSLTATPPSELYATVINEQRLHTRLFSPQSQSCLYYRARNLSSTVSAQQARRQVSGRASACLSRERLAAWSPPSPLLSDRDAGQWTDLRKQGGSSGASFLAPGSTLQEPMYCLFRVDLGLGFVGIVDNFVTHRSSELHADWFLALSCWRGRRKHTRASQGSSEPRAHRHCFYSSSDGKL